jgi:hypothetical protein
MVFSPKKVRAVCTILKSRAQHAAVALLLTKKPRNRSLQSRFARFAVRYEINQLFGEGDRIGDAPLA